ncbi:MAG: B12-binding domain-containing radical SAM protein [Nitrospirota bacterium]
MGRIMITMDIVLNNQLEAGKDYRFLELAVDAGAWPKHDSRRRSLLVSFNTPGYYSLAVRLLALTAHLSPTVNQAWDTRYTEADINEDGKALVDAIIAWKPDLVAFTVNIWNLQRCLDVIPGLKQAMPNSTILFGGQEVTNSVTDFLAEQSDLDYIIDGEGEIPFLQFLASWDEADRKPGSVEAVSGLRFRNDGSTALTRPAELVLDLDTLPSPVLAGLVPVSTKNKLGVMLEGARGCPYQCSFCFEGSRVTKVRMASIERLSAEAHFMAERGSTYFHLMDPILCNSKPERLKGIADLFKDLNRGRTMQISLETYAQHIHDGIAPFLADFTIIDVGLQSINAATQKEIRRSFSMDRFREGLASLRKVNPNFNLYLICGLPHETLKSFLEGIQFVIGERPMRVFINELCLLNGTELRKRAADYGYDFSPAPPYKVFASAWMSRYEMRLANTLANTVYRRYNYSIRALFPLAPWVRNTSPGMGRNIVLDLSSAPDKSAIEERIREAAGNDVELITGQDIVASQTVRLIGQLQLMGASRIKVTAPLAAYTDGAAAERLVALGVLQFTAVMTESQAHSMDLLSNIARTFSMKGYASLKPVTEIVVQQSGEDRAAYLDLVDQACRSAAEIVNIPAVVQGSGDGWIKSLAERFRTQVESGKWMKVPRLVAREALKDVRDRDEVLAMLQQFDLISV